MVGRIGRALAWRGRLYGGNALARAGLASYEPVVAPGGAAWDAYYERGEYEYMREAVDAARYAILVGYVAQIRPATILDLGCGPGILLERMAQLAFRRYVGVDVSAVAIERAQRLGDERARFAVSDRAPADEGPFDLVVCNEVIYVADNPEALLDHARDVVADRGHVLTSVWRHPKDVLVHRMIAARFEPVDLVDVRRVGPGGRTWSRVGWHRKRA